MFEGPEKRFQCHIADYFIREHQYAMLEQDEITDTEYYFAEDHLIAFFKATQKRYAASLIMLWVLGRWAGQQSYAPIGVSPDWSPKYFLVFISHR